MDTTTVNFAINKLSEGWAKVAPAVQDVGDKYVRYVVTEQIVTAGIFAILFIAWIHIFAFTFKKAWKAESEPKLGCVFGYGVSFVFIVAALVFNCRDAALAYTNPEMFAIHNLIAEAKQ